MTRLTDERSSFDWDKEIARMETTAVHRQEAQKLYAEKKLKDGEPFIVTGAKMATPSDPEGQPGWACGMFLKGKFLFAVYNAKDYRLPRLKRQAVARLLEIARTGMVDTRQATSLPPRYQSLKNPDFILFGANSTDTDPESATMAKHQQVFDEREEVAHPGLADA